MTYARTALLLMTICLLAALVPHVRRRPPEPLEALRAD
jgi:hypothetical protein